MKKEPLVVEHILNAPAAKVWKAITDNAQMKKWYFDLAEFRPEVGFEFQFLAGTEEKKYIHLCKVTDVIVGKKISHTWRYDGYDGSSTVTFELFDEGNKTRVRLTHEGLETFPQGDPSFARTSFTQGWTAIIGSSLKDFVEANR